MSIYISPYSVFNLSPTADDGEIAEHHNRVLRQLATYKTENNIQLNGTRMPKSAITALLSELKDATKRSYHIAIFQNKKLLNFLEYGQLNYFRVSPSINTEETEGFDQFLAPYFAEQYSETFLQAIKKHDTETVQLLSGNNLPPIVENFEEQCYQHVNNYLQDTIHTLKQLQKEARVRQLTERQLLTYLPNKTIELYNLLPDYFFVTRNLIGSEVYQAALVMSERLGHSNNAAILLEQGLKLRLDTTIRQDLQDLLDESKLRYKVPSFIVLGVLAVLLLFVIQYIEYTFFVK